MTSIQDYSSSTQGDNQNFGASPETVRETDHYQAEYIEEFADRWDRLIDWDARAQAEGDFFIRILREHGARSVLDVATGTGFHSVRLLREGFDVVSADGNPNMLARAFRNARNRDLLLRTAQADWRFLNRDIHGLFDAVICLGNSFTHLFKERDRRKSLAEYYAVLKHNGVLIMDHRNYDRLLEGGGAVRNGKGNVYCGEDVEVAPEHVDEGLARFRYAFSDSSTYHLNMFPLRYGYVRRLMSEVGFQKITSFGDYQRDFENPDFYIHVAEKEYRFDVDTTMH
ncbi:class I SAM-dependent methyltransferase [Synechococcus sp. MIT S1220]|uniref:glycine/sarcosine N-methyltransferase n=1 Tax=Synechococcus sp. MIT S1220 TaxID=3082549 RepID=UPI0039B048C8